MDLRVLRRRPFTAIMHAWIGATAAVLIALAGGGRAAAQETASSGERLGPAPPGLQPVLRTIARAPSSERIREDITTLVGFGTRHTLSDTTSEERGIGAARRWVHAELRRISEGCGGCLEVRYQRTVVPPGSRIPDSTEVVNVMAVQPGTADSDRYVVISGHLDSRVSDIMNDTARAPGANDDASGVAGVLESARVLSDYSFSANIVYLAVTGEEQGLYGSTYAAETFKEHGWRVEAMLNNDMIGNIQGQDGVVDNTVVRIFSEGTRGDETDRMARIRRFTGGENDAPSRNLARYVARTADRYVRNLDPMMIYRLDRFGRGGDQMPFTEEGYPAVRLTEAHEDYRRQHQDVRVEDGTEYGDVLGEVEFDYAAKVTGLNAAVLASLAWAPPPPRGVEIEGAVAPSTTLRWDRFSARDTLSASTASDLAGFKVYWRRTTSPRWEKSVFVGDTTAHTLKDVVIDNYIFGVASVSKDGFESPVVFPGPVGSFLPAEWQPEE